MEEAETRSIIAADVISGSLCINYERKVNHENPFR